MKINKRYFGNYIIVFIYSFLIWISFNVITIYAEEASPLYFLEDEYHIKSNEVFIPSFYYDERIIDYKNIYYDIDGLYYEPQDEIRFDYCSSYTITISDGTYIDTAIVYVDPPDVTNFTVEFEEDYTVLKWDEMGYGYDDIEIFRAIDNPKGEYYYLGASSWYETYYNDYSYVSGVKYYYKVRTHARVMDKDIYSDFSSPILIYEENIPLAISSIIASKANTITIKWDYSNDFDGYYIYRSINQDSGFKKIKTIKNKLNLTDNSFSNKNLKPGTKYYYKIAAYETINDKNIVLYTSKVRSEIARIGATKIIFASSPRPRTNLIKWKKIDNANGYFIYRAKKAKGKYKLIKTINNKKITKYTQKNVVNGTAYYYKIIPFMKINNEKISGVSMKPYEKYCDYYSYENEDYFSKYKRIFKKSSKSYYDTNEEAMSNMKKIQIKVWDLNSNGKKYTRIFSLTVHKNIAPSVQMMFKEIYNSKEKFPIHDIGCYSWRTNNPDSEHCLGLALDINANENYMIDGKVIMAGSFWKPGVNPYSIPKNCELVIILKKYGFTRGFWGDRADYMHFSYFGT